MTKPTDEEAADRRVLARKLAVDLQERVSLLRCEGNRKRPNINSIRSECQVLRESIDHLLAKYDAKHGTETEWVGTESRLRGFITKQAAHIDDLTRIVEWQQAHSKKRDALLSDGVQIIEALVDLCTRNGVAIPLDLMRPPQ